MVRLLGFSLLILKLTVTWSLLFTPAESITDEIYALNAFKRAIYEDPYSTLSDWNIQDGDPCVWSGVTCSYPDYHVITLALSNSSLKGFLAPEIGSLYYLQELILDNNLFLGPLPKEIGTISSLYILNLSVNQFSGPIPSELGDLKSISKIDLHSNLLTGEIPIELGNLQSLVELQLDRNKLTGVIPGTNDSNVISSAIGNNNTGLCKLTHLSDANFSYNYFDGNIPSCLQWLPKSSFQENCLKDSNSISQRPTQQCANGQDNSKGSPTESSNRHKRKNTQPLWLLILEIITGFFIVIFVIICTLATIRRYRARPSTVLPRSRSRTTKTKALNNHTVSTDENLLENVTKISRRDLEEACEDFSNIIGSFSDTIIYKGTMKDGSEIAVVSLCVSRNYWTTSFLELYFKKEVSDLARLNHENIAKLVGYCKEYDPFSRMLVFEYASNGTLYEHLHDGDGCILSWLRRMRIALGIARGLRYLHTEINPTFALTELTSSSVYLTEDFSPKIVDFERWKCLSAKPGVNSDCIFDRGSFESFNGFMDSQQSRYMYIQTNTFAFGVILLELISGRPPFSKDTGYLVDWAVKCLENPQEISNLVDPELKKVKQESLSILCSVITLCIESEPSKRPSMELITAMLEEGIDTSAAAVLKDSNLAWAELEIS